jgi:hypothetical protein
MCSYTHADELLFDDEDDEGYNEGLDEYDLEDEVRKEI